MAFLPPSATVFSVPPKVLALQRVLSGASDLDGSHIWVLGILRAEGAKWELEEGGERLALDVGPEVGAALLDPLWVNEGRRCAVQGALFSPSQSEPFLVVERVVTARALGLTD